MEALLVNKNRIEEYSKNKEKLIEEWNDLVSTFYNVQSMAERIKTNVSGLNIDDYELESEIETIDKLMSHVNGLSSPKDNPVYINNILLDESNYKIVDTLITINEKSVKSVILNKKSNKQLAVY